MMTVDKTKLPQLFQAADTASVDGQATYLAATKARLAFIVAAAAFGVTSWRVGDGDVDVLALLSLACFVVALVVELYLLESRPERRWYDGRAVAESVKTLAWKFVAGGHPFPRTMSSADASRLLADRLGVLRSRFDDLDLAATRAATITEWMQSTRHAPLAVRRQTYLEDRIQDQESWYTDAANLNQQASRRWRFTLLALEIVGVGGSLIEALVDIGGVILTPTIAALVGAVVAWSETKRHEQTARAYAAAVADLSNARAKLNLAVDEATWAAEVNDAEEAISREHTLWLASRSRA